MTTEEKSFEDLVAIARAAGQDEHEYWNCVGVLYTRTDETNVGQILELSKGDAFDREFSGAILGRMGVPELTDRVLEMLAIERDDAVVASLISALGQGENDPRILEATLPYFDHPNREVRWSVTLRLGQYETDSAVEKLLLLSADSDDMIREWATFGLKNMESVDTPTVRAAFVARLDDPDWNTCLEAIVGLAKRRDERAVAAVLHEVGEDGSSELFDHTTDSPHDELLADLNEIANHGDYMGDLNELRLAISRCENLRMK